MADYNSIPKPNSPVLDTNGHLAREWYDYLRRNLSSDDLSSIEQQIRELDARVAAVDNSNFVPKSTKILGNGSVQTLGNLAQGVVTVTLVGDSESPGLTFYYGTDEAGNKGWFALSDAFQVTSDLTKTVDSGGISTYGLADLPNSGTGTAVYKTTRDAKGRTSGQVAATTDDLPEGSSNLYFTNARAAAAAPVQSVNGQTGAVSITPANIGAATAAQGAKADTAVQQVRPGTNVTIDNTDPLRPIVNAAATSGVPEAPSDGYPYVRKDGAWEQTNGTSARYWLIEYPLLTDQAGNQLTDQAGNLLIANSPIVPPGWPATTTTTVTAATTPQAMTLAQANALANPQDFQIVAITDLTGGREPCWYDASVSSGTKWRRFSDRSIAT